MISKLSERLYSFKGSKIGVISHVRPDADCIGAQIALSRWLMQLGVEVIACNDDPVPPNLEWMLQHYSIRKTDFALLKDCSAYVFVDGNHPDRFGDAGRIAEKSGKPMFMIDHHPDPADVFEIMVSDVNASSTCELVYQLFDHPGTSMDLPAAEAIYAGIITDTGSFRFDSVSARTHEVVAELIKAVGLETEPIHRKIFDGRTLNQLQLLARALNSVQMHQNNRIATLSVTQKLLRETGTSYHDLEGIVNYGLGIRGVQAAVLLCELDNKVKLSLRSNSHIDVNIWARELNGGGHVKAAGAFHDGPLEKAVEETVAIGAKQLKNEE